jgi:hypothetical protein
MSSENLVGKISPQKYLRVNSFHAWRLFSALVILLIGQGWTFATIRAGTDTSGLKSPGGLTKHVYGDAKHVLSWPLPWKQYDMILLACLSVATLSAVPAGRDLHELYI